MLWTHRYHFSPVTSISLHVWYLQCYRLVRPCGWHCLRGTYTVAVYTGPVAFSEVDCMHHCMVSEIDLSSFLLIWPMKCSFSEGKPHNMERESLAILAIPLRYKVLLGSYFTAISSCSSWGYRCPQNPFPESSCIIFTFLWLLNENTSQPPHAL